MANLNIPKTFKVTPEQFQQLASVNRDFRLETSACGELVIMPPTGSNTGYRNLDIEGQLWLWNRTSDLGIAFNSSSGFQLPNGANRSPDAAWVTKQKWNSLTEEEKEGFAPLCPDFVVELRSPSDSLKPLQAKMQEYLDNGTRLGWLIDRKHQKVEIYRPNQKVEILFRPLNLSGEDVLLGFVLDLSRVW